MLQSCFGIVGFLLLFFLQPIEACTGIKVNIEDGHAVNGRTLEFGVEVQTSVAVIPRGYSFMGTTPMGEGLSYKAKYAVVGTIAYGTLAIMDGLNEKGLSVGTFYFPGYAGYVETTKENRSQSLSPVDFSNWLLAQFSTLDEVKEGVGEVFIAPTVSKEWGAAPPPFHYIVYDRTGMALVIEPIGGKLVLYDNPLGVLTNSPTFDWHITHLRSFLNLSPNNVGPLDLSGFVLTPIGQGSGLVGLPGDFTPPSRFVRGVFFSANSFPAESSEAAVFSAFHILNQFDIPDGSVRQRKSGSVHRDITQATCVKDPVQLRYYFKTFSDQRVKCVDLNRFDLSGKEVRMISTAGVEEVIDLSSSLK